MFYNAPRVHIKQVLHVDRPRINDPPYVKVIGIGNYTVHISCSIKVFRGVAAHYLHS